MTLKHDIERLERELQSRGSGNVVDLPTWATHKSELCQKLGLDAASIADTAQEARDAGCESIAAQVASMLGMTVGELQKALRR